MIERAFDLIASLDFGPYRLVPAHRLLIGNGVPVPLGMRGFDILASLVERRHMIVSKDELTSRVWGGQAVEENTLAVHLSAPGNLPHAAEAEIEAAVAVGAGWTEQQIRPFTKAMPIDAE